MKKFVVVLLIVALFVVSCAAGASNDPKEVVEEYIKANFAGDFDKIKTLIKKSDAEVFETTRETYAKIKAMNIEAEVKIDDLKISGKNATAEIVVTLKVKGGKVTSNKPATVGLVIEDGKWVVDSSKVKIDK